MQERALVERLDKIETCLSATHDAVIRLEVKVNGGPGCTLLCNQHADRVRNLAERMLKIEQKMWYGMGVIGIIVFLTSLFSPVIRQLLKIGP